MASRPSPTMASAACGTSSKCTAKTKNCLVCGPYRRLTPLRNEIDLKRPHVFEPKPLRRPAGVATELRNGMKIRSLRRGQQVAKAHVVDHTTTQRAYRCRGFSNGMVAWLWVGPTTKPSHQEAIPANRYASPRVSGFVQSPLSTTPKKKQSGSAPGPVPGDSGLKRIVNGNDAEHPVFGIDDW